MKTVLALLFLVVVVYADTYMQNPRGSNNRLSTATENTNDQNRLFDSQNNAKGGYQWGPALTYLEGSQLPVEWTSQHGCGSDQVTCNVIIQYMCSDPAKDPASIAVRDGVQDTTIPENANTYNAKTGADYTYGMHESYDYYEECKNRDRNQGLFTADQNLGGDSALYTRQQPNVNRHGFECPEEKDYYPYWGPTPWKDVVAFAPTADLCAVYQAESQNVKPKEKCTGAKTTNNLQPITQTACTAAGGTWTTVAAFGIAAPDCQISPYSRDNHLGNGLEATTAAYNWTIPTLGCAAATGCDCALRLRYNISNDNADAALDATLNGENSPVTGDPTQTVEGNPLEMAVDTAQYGRTFEDRSHTFHIAPRPQGIAADTPIYNLNVRGKRGNIVQTFPATEYDYVPNNLVVNQGDIVHFQWTGADTNPQANDGEGTDGTDRTNIVQVASLNDNLPLTQAQINQGNTLFDTPSLRSSMAYLGQTNCKTTNDQQDPQNCAKLNAAPAYFNAGPVRVNKTGTFYYMNSRNNNFSNRTQKGMIIVNGVADLSEGSIAAIVICSILGVTLICGVAGTFIYAKRNPHSKLAELYDKIHLPSFGSSSSSSSMSYSTNGDRSKPLLG